MSEFTEEELALGERMFSLQPDSPWTAFCELRELFGALPLERRQALYDTVVKRRSGCKGHDRQAGGAVPTRKITCGNYAATCAELICAFAAAIDAERRGRDDKDLAASGALELAASCGWDWGADPTFAAWAPGATAEESLVEALQKTLSTVRAKYDAVTTGAPR